MNYFKYITIILFAICGLSACSEDDLDDRSIFEGTAIQRAEFDNWLLNNYVYPYNVDFKMCIRDRCGRTQKVLQYRQHQQRTATAAYQ